MQTLAASWPVPSGYAAPLADGDGPGELKRQRLMTPPMPPTLPPAPMHLTADAAGSGFVPAGGGEASGKGAAKAAWAGMGVGAGGKALYVKGGAGRGLLPNSGPLPPRGPGPPLEPAPPLSAPLPPSNGTLSGLALPLFGGAAYSGRQAPPPRPVFLAPALAGIQPRSSKLPATNSKHIAMTFVNADRETQTKMLQDPSVARAILQTLSESPQQPPGSMVSLLGASLGGGGGGATAMTGPAAAASTAGVAAAAPPPAAPTVMPALNPPAAPSGAAFVGAVGVPSTGGAAPPAWSGSITLARNMAKRLQTRAVLLHGRVQDVEVALRCAAGNYGVLDITHRVPFDEVAKRSPATLLAMTPSTAAEQALLEEYIRYFRTKERAGVVKLEGTLSLYTFPAGEDILPLQSSVYALGPHVPRSGCILGLIAQGTVAGPAAGAAAGVGPAASSSSSAAVAPAPQPQSQTPAAAMATPEAARGGTAGAPPTAAAPRGGDAAAMGAGVAAASPAKVDGAPLAEDGGGGAAAAAAPGVTVSSKELMDLFSNPELIKLLSDDGPLAGDATNA